jgi:glycosyltransferase involved in cell wall biosynthesis
VRPIRLDLERQGYRYAREFEGNFRGLAHDLGADEFVEMRAGDVFLGLDLVYDRIPQLREWFRAFRRWGGRVVFLVYDILAVRHPQWWWPGAGEDFERWLRSVAEVSTKLVAISRAVADDLQDWLWSSGAPHDPGLSIEYFHLGADLSNSAPTKGLPADHQSVLRELARRPTFLMVGTIEPRKGHKQALSAFERLWMAGVKANLVIVGKHGWSMDGFMDRLRRHPELGRHLFWLDYVTDEYLEKLYASASCLIVASEGEGFGLPLIEAAQHKLPIIARDIPVFREVAEENAYFFCGVSGEALASAVKGWLALSARGAVPASEAIRWLTWAESATQLMDVVLGSDVQIHSNADVEAP